ncbi:hypothetical protein GCM10012320_16260 [Sinomonas cellulolyticus]|uniref:Uncharacterized protein n=1 Tax=Sinomonas cellulolyticus TaxID=2801916 RepID=A0ABS1JYH9_9MICC|nr:MULTISPECIES: hypothetical protein [Sinomonas]MBL0704451.1 hypothetical protein [Sinomonas cellulolyticus]GHG48750.1 hypothetical protein GCM10012320_16260 [Sinomonas sp. KCTC 49339]
MASPPTSTPSRRALRRNDARPVFVDASGGKLRMMRLLGAVTLLVVAAYLVAVGVALLSDGPNAAAPSLPDMSRHTAAPVPPPASGGEGGPTPAVIPTAAPASVAEVAARAQDPAAPAPGAAAPAAPAQPAGTAPAVAPAAPAPTAAAPAPATAAAPVNGNATAPGQTRRATPTTRP